MVEPAELIALASNVADCVFMWTHYYDPDVVGGDKSLASRFGDVSTSEYAGFRHRLYRYEYGPALDWSGFCGGSRPYSNWMTKTDILSCLEHFGFVDIQQSFDGPHHPNGPSFALLARHRSAPRQGGEPDRHPALSPGGHRVAPRTQRAGASQFPWRTAMTRLISTSFNVCTFPLGQWISTFCTDAAFPSPKCTPSWLEDA